MKKNGFYNDILLLNSMTLSVQELEADGKLHPQVSTLIRVE